MPWQKHSITNHNPHVFGVFLFHASVIPHYHLQCCELFSIFCLFKICWCIFGNNLIFTGPIQDLNGQVRAIRANLSLINPVWDLYGLPVLNPQYHALINPVWDLYVFARMISATTGPYRSCMGSVWVCLNLQQGGSPKRRETHWRRRLAPTLNNNWHGLCFYSLIPR